MTDVFLSLYGEMTGDDIDRESYWRHLTRQHPERFDDGVAS